MAREAQAGAPHGGRGAARGHQSGSSFTIDDNAFTVPSTTPGRSYTATVSVKAATTASVGKTVQLKLRERAAGGTVVADVSSPSDAHDLLEAAPRDAHDDDLGREPRVRVSHGRAVSGTAMFVDAFGLTAGAGTPPPNQAPTASFTVSPSSPRPASR